MRFRPVLALAGAVAVALATAASAAPGPKTLTFADPAGDNISPSKASDITGVSFSTAGTGKGKAYVAKSLVITMQLAAPPTSDGMVIYGIDAQLTGCGRFSLSYMPGASVLDNFNSVECAGSDDPMDTSGTFDATPEVKGSSLVWALSFKSLPTPVKAGSVFTDLEAYTDFVDPVLSIVGPRTATGITLYDTASTDKPYTVG